MALTSDGLSSLDSNEVFVMFRCWYDGDSYLVSDSFVAMSTNIIPLVEKAKELGATDIIFPGKKVEDDGQYGDKRRRFRISVEIILR